MADLFSDGLKYGKIDRTPVLQFPLYSLYLAYQDVQVICIPYDPHTSRHPKRHLEILFLLHEEIIEQKRYHQGDESSEMCNTIAGRIPGIQE
jgi:hypothetical protein